MRADSILGTVTSSKCAFTLPSDGRQSRWPWNMTVPVSTPAAASTPGWASLHSLTSAQRPLWYAFDLASAEGMRVSPGSLAVGRLQG
jgi:hypothetical protein